MTSTTSTDTDRLTEAFRLLNDRGILAVQRVWCCMTCASAVLHAAVDGTPYLRGTVFYHDQDAMMWEPGDLLYLGYAGAGPGDETSPATAEATVAALREVGLEVKWNGSLATRIAVRLHSGKMPGYWEPEWVGGVLIGSPAALTEECDECGRTACDCEICDGCGSEVRNCYCCDVCREATGLCTCCLLCGETRADCCCE